MIGGQAAAAGSIMGDLAITIAATAIELSRTYPDGSRVQITLPKPKGFEAQAQDQIELAARQMARRLLAIASEDFRSRS